MTIRPYGGPPIEATFSNSDKVALAALCLSVVVTIIGATLWLTSQINGVSERVTRIEARMEEQDRRHP